MSENVRVETQPRRVKAEKPRKILFLAQPGGTLVGESKPFRDIWELCTWAHKKCGFEGVSAPACPPYIDVPEAVQSAEYRKTMPLGTKIAVHRSFASRHTLTVNNNSFTQRSSCALKGFRPSNSKLIVGTKLPPSRVCLRLSRRALFLVSLRSSTSRVIVAIAPRSIHGAPTRSGFV